MQCKAFLQKMWTSLHHNSHCPRILLHQPQRLQPWRNSPGPLCGREWYRTEAKLYTTIVVMEKWMCTLLRGGCAMCIPKSKTTRFETQCITQRISQLSKPSLWGEHIHKLIQSRWISSRCRRLRLRNNLDFRSIIKRMEAFHKIDKIENMVIAVMTAIF